MSADFKAPDANSEKMHPFRVPGMYHPSHDVLDIDAAERWYAQIFGTPSVSLASLMAKLPPRPGSGYPPNYSTFTLIGDVLLDSIDPLRLVIAGVQRFPSITEPHLRSISWYVDDMDAAFRALKCYGTRLVNQLDELVDGDEAPTAFGSSMKIFFTVPDDTGLRYAFTDPKDVKATDLRQEPGWILRSPSPSDPLGLRFCSHHTILSLQPDRVLNFLCNGLGARIFQTGRNELLAANSQYVFLGDTTVEIAVPDENSAAHSDWAKRAPNDTYHAITWVVTDLARAEAHLTAQAVRIRARSTEGFITDPATSLGIPWGFRTSPIPGDPRCRHRQ